MGTFYFLDLQYFVCQAEDGIRDFCLSRGLGDVYKRQAIFAALCFISFTFLQIKIPLPGGGDATSLHIGNAFCVLAALLLGGGYGGLAGAIGMTIADVLLSLIHI
eukprot:TRINITY_DN24445_c0_g1_i1.p3 TRINITY_DN24445_c0_g1~~TRINITY_DN24445_c0_g1_i1.p3  ORF type:complete len:105 (-),score=14.88 TRINITY_DN24445_c0_g1_i1:140-454(-)